MSAPARTGASPATSAPAALRIRNLRFRYDRATEDAAPVVVDCQQLDLAPGEEVLLSGRSGSGKSTLLHLVAGLLDPLSGSVHVAGTDIHALHGPARDLFRGRNIGMIFQTFHLLAGFSAAENVMLAMLAANLPAKDHRPRAVELLRALGLAHVDRAVDRLSVGQQQRVAVARAVACRPTLVLADEPTASLDPENGAIAIELIREACRRSGAALLVTSHDPSMPERFERRVAIDSDGVSQPT